MSPSFFYRAASERMRDLARSWEMGDGDGFVRISVRRRTWRTLWLVRRTERVKVPTVRVALSTAGYEPPPPDPRIKRLTADGSPFPRPTMVEIGDE